MNTYVVMGLSVSDNHQNFVIGQINMSELRRDRYHAQFFEMYPEPFVV